MKKIILTLAVTLDGFIAGPDGELDWLVKDEDIDFADILNDILADIDTIFYGRISYDLWGNYQPDDASPKLKKAYDLLQSKKKYVFSRTKKNDNTGATFINGNIKENVSEIIQQPGKNIWLYGGGKLISTFINAGLIDVFRLAVHPVIIGSGIPLFNDIKERTRLKLIEAKGYSSGVTLLKYETDRNKTTS